MIEPTFLRIGEAARLLGVSTKTLRHYERLGLIDEAARSEAGYRLYGAADLLRLSRVRKLQQLGIALGDIGALLADGADPAPLQQRLTSLLAETDQTIARLQERSTRIRELLDDGAVDAIDRPLPHAPLEQARVRLRHQRADVHVSDATTELDRRMIGSIDMLHFPREIEERNEATLAAFAERPELYAQLVAFLERVTLLEHEPDDSAAIATLANEMLDSPVGSFLRTRRREALESPLQALTAEMLTSNVSPAQRRFFERLRAGLQR